MASPAFSEKVIFQRQQTISDGAGGKKVSGLPSSFGPYFAEITEKPYTRLTDSEKLTFRNIYTAKIWKNPNYEPQEGDVCEFRGKSLIIQELSETPDYRHYIIKMVAKR